MNDSLSIFARALATENLTFAFDADANTASFDVRTRHLTMPVWNVSDTMMTMLVAHEIAHALWTPHADSERLFAEAEAEGFNARALHSIMNMIEDVRIEKLMKAKYPGTRRDFFLGYREMIDKDMFGLASYPWEKTDLISRLNGHFKWGLPGFITVPLTTEDQEVAAMVDAVQTFEEGFILAKSLYKHPSMAQFVQNRITEDKGKGNNVGEEGDTESGPADLSDLPGSFQKKDGETYAVANFTISNIKNLSEAIIPSSFVLNAYDKQLNNSLPEVLDKYRKFVRESDAFVRQLVAQFERRKAADEIRKERPKQTGLLNLDRLHQYRTHDDIFLSKIVKQEGKNHGIMFLIDFSGSMGDTIGNCIHQVLQLVWFCEKAKIPFEVYGFTDLAHWGRDEQYVKERDAYIRSHINDPHALLFRPSYLLQYDKPSPMTVEIGTARLVQLASSADSPAQREKLLAYLYGSYCIQASCPVIPYGGTPTVEGVAIASQRMKEWVVANNIQIPTLMIVTDGQPNGISSADGKFQNSYINENAMLTVRNEIFGTVHKIDHAAFGNIEIPNAMIAAMLDGLQKNLNARCVGMYVISPKTLPENMFRAFCLTPKERESFRHQYHYTSAGKSPRYDACAEAYRDGAVILPKSVYPGFDAFFLIRSMRAVADEEAFTDGGSFVKVKNTFIKTMGKRGASRVFLSKYVDIVAGQPLRDNEEPMHRLAPGLTWDEMQKK